MLGREPLAPLDGALMARKRMFFDGSRAVRELGMPQSPVRGRAGRRRSTGSAPSGGRRDHLGAPRPRRPRRGPRRPRPAAWPTCAGCSTPRASGGASWSRTRPSPPSTSSCCTPWASPTTTRGGGSATSCWPSSATTAAWANWYSGPADLSTTVEAYYALRLCGLPADDPRMARARDVVLALGGANRARFFTKLWLAVMGRYPWIGAAGAAARDDPAAGAGADVALPLRLLGPRHVRRADDRAVAQPDLPPAGGPGRALHRPARARAGAAAEDARPLDPGPDAEPVARRGATTGGRSRRCGACPSAASCAGSWSARRPTAPWGGIQPPWIYSIIALHALGLAARPPGDRARARRASTTRSPSTSTTASACASRPACRRSGTPAWRPSPWPTPARPRTTRPCDAACDWLLAQGGHALRRLALRAAARPPGRLVVRVRERVVPRHRRHRRGAASRCGAPATRRRTRRSGAASTGCWRCRAATAAGARSTLTTTAGSMTQIPLCDFGEVIDPPTEDVTAHVVEALVECGVPRRPPAVRRGVAYLWRTQRPDGSWWGRWGVNHIYGTGAALPALAAAGEDMRCPRRAAGRGVAGRAPERGRRLGRERPRATPTRSGSGAATRRASQTAWALLALPAADAGAPRRGRGPGVPGAHPAPRRLVGRAAAFTGTGFPMDFMIQLPPLPPGLPGDRAREAAAVSAGVAAAARRRPRPATRAHDENFPVAFLLAPRDVRADMGAVYSFCRTTDDIGDEGPAARRAPGAARRLRGRPAPARSAAATPTPAAGGAGRRDRAAAA